MTQNYSTVRTLLANSLLRYAIGAGNTVIECQPGNGALFPSTYKFYIVLSSDDPARTEVVACTARSTDAFDVSRGQFGTTASVHPPGALFELVNPTYLLDTGVIKLNLETSQSFDLADDSVDSEHYVATSIDKEHLASEIYAIEHIVVSGEGLDNQTIKATTVRSAGTIVHVDYFTDAAIGTNLGIDVIDGATDGSGTDVIDSCADNLNGFDPNPLTTPYALSAGDVINVKFDDITGSVYSRVDVYYKVPLGAAT